MLLTDAKTGCVATMCPWFNQVQMPWCFAYQVAKVGFVAITSVSCKNHPIRGLCCDSSWPLTTSMQEMQRFASRVVKSCKLFCCPLLKDSIVFFVGKQCLRVVDFICADN